MNKNKRTKGKKIAVIGVFNLLISTLFIRENFDIFLFFFIIFSMCLIYSRKYIVKIVGRPIIKEIIKQNNIKLNLKKDVKELESEYNKIIKDLSKKQTYINEINEYREKINQLELKEKQINIEIVNISDKKILLNKIK